MASSNHPDDNALGKVGLALFTYAINISIPDIASGRRLCLGQAGKGYPHWRAIAKPLVLSNSLRQGHRKGRGVQSLRRIFSLE